MAPKQSRAGVSLMFDAGRRPCAAQVKEALAREFSGMGSAGMGSAQVSHMPDAAKGWLELVASGLTFDLSGLAPAPGVARAPGLYRFGLASEAGKGWEAIELAPGPHIAGAAHLMPVTRVMAGLAAGLGESLGVRAVGWLPADTWMAPDYARKIIASWLSGGPFPALGLTALEVNEAGVVRSVGLRFFTGQEIVVSPAIGASPTDTVRQAARIIDRLVTAEPVEERQTIVIAGGASVVLEPSGDGACLNARPA